MCYGWVCGRVEYKLWKGSVVQVVCEYEIWLTLEMGLWAPLAHTQCVYDTACCIIDWPSQKCIEDAAMLYRYSVFQQ